MDEKITNLTADQIKSNVSNFLSQKSTTGLNDAERQIQDRVKTLQGNKPSGAVPNIDASKVGNAERLDIPANTNKKGDKALATINAVTDTPQSADFNSLFTDILNQSGLDPEDTNKIQQFLNSSGGQFTKAGESALQNLLSTQIDQKARKADTRKLQEKAGLPELESELAGFQSELNTMTAARDSRTINETQGSLSKTAVANRQNEIQRQYGLQVADNRINQLVTAGKINAATQLIDAKMDLKYGDLEEEIALYQAQLDSIAPFMDAEQKKLGEQRSFILNQASAQIQAKRDSEKEVELTKLEALKNAIDRGATPRQIAQIQDAKTTQEIASSGFLTSALEKSQLRTETLTQNKLASDIEANNRANQPFDIMSLIGTVDGDKVKLEDSSILQSTQFDKELDASQVTEINQAKLALSGVETLTALLQQGKDGLDLSGPVTGRVRSFLTKLGGDTDAAGINAAIQGLIPTVARGIFGEVGVLTDADIENYKKTLPNLTSSNDQNKLVTLIMLDVLENSFTNTLKSNAQAGRNTSRFYPDLLDIRNRIAQQKLNMGVTSFTGQETEDFLDAAPEEPQGIQTTLGTFNPMDFNSFMKFNQ